jgi:putative tryptophan/tyrosine transport system substrate-binding protein
VAHARTDSNLETAFATFSQQRVSAFLVAPTTFYLRRMEQLGALAARHALPRCSHSMSSPSPAASCALAGGLMSYGSSFAYTNRQVDIYTGRILKGEKPADLSVEQAAKLETAKALGLTIPETLLATADEVIQ